MSTPTTLDHAVNEFLRTIGGRIGAVSGCRANTRDADVLGEAYRPQLMALLRRAENDGRKNGLLRAVDILQQAKDGP